MTTLVPAPLPVPKALLLVRPVAKAGALLARLYAAMVSDPGPTRWT